MRMRGTGYWKGSDKKREVDAFHLHHLLETAEGILLSGKRASDDGEKWEYAVLESFMLLILSLKRRTLDRTSTDTQWRYT